MEPESLQALARWAVFWLGVSCNRSSLWRAARLDAGPYLPMLSSDTVVDTHWLLDLGGEAKACGPEFQNLDMGIDHTASVSL